MFQVLQHFQIQNFIEMCHQKKAHRHKSIQAVNPKTHQ